MARAESPAHAGFPSRAVRIAAALLVADAVAITLLTIPRSVLQGENLGYKRIDLSTVLVLAQGGLTAAALALDTGIEGIAVANLIGTLLTGALFWRVAKQNVPGFGIARPSRETRRWLFGLSWWFTAWKFVTQLMTGGDVLVLGVFASVNLVTVYSLTKFIPEALVSLMAILLQGAGPGLGGIIGSGDNRKALAVRSEMLTLTWLIATIAGAAVMLWNESFVRLRVGGRFYSGATSMLLVVMVLQFVHIRYEGQGGRVRDLVLLNVDGSTFTTLYPHPVQGNGDTVEPIDYNADGAADFIVLNGATRTVGPVQLHTLSDDPTVPEAPVLTAVAGNRSVCLAWTAPENGGSAITGYRVYRRGILIAELGMVRSYRDTAVENDKNYKYAVSAVNAVGEGPGRRR